MLISNSITTLRTHLVLIHFSQKYLQFYISFRYLQWWSTTTRDSVLHNDDWFFNDVVVEMSVNFVFSRSVVQKKTRQTNTDNLNLARVMFVKEKGPTWCHSSSCFISCWFLHLIDIIALSNVYLIEYIQNHLTHSYQDAIYIYTFVDSACRLSRSKYYSFKCI